MLEDCIDHGQCGYNGGYGRRKTGNGYMYLHRAALATKLGRELLPGEVARHTCDNPRCVNPEHLLVGTKADNNRDMAERGRASSGEHRPNHKLTDALIAEIRTTVIRGHPEFGVTATAKRLGISKGTLSVALNGKTWRANA